MECFLITLGVLIFILISALSERSQRSRQLTWDYRVYNQAAPRAAVRSELGSDRFRNLQRSFAKLAEELAGEIIPAAIQASPRVILNQRGTRVMLSLQDTQVAQTRLREETARFYTRLTFKMPPGWQHRLELFPQDTAMDARYLKMFDIQIGHREFDGKYVIKASDPDFAKEFLDAAARKAVDDLAGLPPFIYVIVSLNRERLIVSKPGIMEDLPTLRRYVECAFRFYSRIEEVTDRASGLEVVAAGGGEEMPVCNVCGGEISKEAQVFCRRCSTPLHHDCWTYNGKCAVFGCGETRFR